MSLLNQSIACLKDANLYLEVLSPEEYQRPIELMSGASIGQHTRHFIEFFQCLTKQVQTGTVNYDLRQRDLQIESDPTFTLSVIQQVEEAMLTMDMDQSLDLEACFGETVSVSSNVAREVLYNLEHCIHHLALIKIGLAIIRPDLKLPKHFGVAVSTIKHREQMAELASR